MYYKCLFYILSFLILLSCKNPNGPYNNSVDSIFLLNQSEQEKPFEIRQVLFDSRPGDIYRIPGIVVSKKSSLIAVVDSRKTSESDVGFSTSANIDIYVRRSEDGGKTWSDVIVVPPKATSKFDAHGDPLIFSANNGDLVLLCAAGGGWVQQVSLPSKIARSISKDDGKTWSDWEEIQTSIFNDSKMAQQGFVKGFAGSGRGLTLEDGTLIGAMLIGNQDNSQVGTAVIASRDNGITWSVIAVNSINNVDEPKAVARIVEGAYRDKILLSIRSGTAGKRRFFSFNFPSGPFMEIYNSGAFNDPRVNAEGVRYTLKSKGHSKNRILHTYLDSTSSRQNLTLVMSDNEGESWTAGKKLLKSGNAGYSSIDVLPDGTIVILSEEENDIGSSSQNGHYDIVFRRFNLNWFTGEVYSNTW